jgi:hypothetical protein
MKEPLVPTTTNLQDELVFPSFRECPYESDTPHAYWRDLGGGVYLPRRHWCYLGEITERIAFIPLCLAVQDRKGDEVLATFYPDSGGMISFPVHPNVPESLANKGNTIAILYAEQHNFLEFDGSIGFRIEDADQVQVRPTLLEGNLLKRSPYLVFPLYFGTTPRSRRSDFE